MIRSLTHGPATVLPALMAFAFTGCGGRPTVEGTVTLDGSPLDGGMILFFPPEAANPPNRAAPRLPKNPRGSNVPDKAHAPISGGQFVVEAGKGPDPGMYRVSIVWFKKTGKKVPSSYLPGLEDEMSQALPKKYNEDTELTAEITSGKNTLHYDLTSK